MRPILFPLLVATLSGPALAASPQDILRGYAAQARMEFSAQKGEDFYRQTRNHSSGKTLSCATCHTDDPRRAGSHEKTRKEVKPLAPSANPERFTDPAKVEKWFKRNCQDVLERACTLQEKGDLLAWLINVR